MGKFSKEHVEAVRTRDRHGSVPKHLKLKKAYRVETPGSNIDILEHCLRGCFGMVWDVFNVTCCVVTCRVFVF